MQSFPERISDYISLREFSFDKNMKWLKYVEKTFRSWAVNGGKDLIGAEFGPAPVLSSHRSVCDVFWSVSQRVSGQSCFSQASSHWEPPPTLCLCACARECVWWQMRGRSHREGRKTRQTTSCHYSLGEFETATQPWDLLITYLHTHMFNKTMRLVGFTILHTEKGWHPFLKYMYKWETYEKFVWTGLIRYKLTDKNKTLAEEIKVEII